MFFRILKGFDSVDADHFFFELEDGGGYGLRGHRLKLKVQMCRLKVRQNFFSVRIVNYRSLLWSLLLLMCSRRDWTTGLQMWIVKVLLLIHYITSYKSEVTSN